MTVLLPVGLKILSVRYIEVKEGSSIHHADSVRNEEYKLLTQGNYGGKRYKKRNKYEVEKNENN